MPLDIENRSFSPSKEKWCVNRKSRLSNYNQQDKYEAQLEPSDISHQLYFSPPQFYFFTILTLFFTTSILFFHHLNFIFHYLNFIFHHLNFIFYHLSFFAARLYFLYRKTQLIIRAAGHCRPFVVYSL